MKVREWETWDVADWEVVADEPRGKRLKDWRRAPDGSVWLCKRALKKKAQEKRPARLRAFEPVVECIALRAAEASGLDVPESQPCFVVDHGIRSHALVTRRFLDIPRESLTDGAALLEAQDAEYDRNDHGMHTLHRVLTCLRQDAYRHLVKPFIQLMLFDAWIGNSDRHQENWGVITSRGTSPRLAPVFDVGSCLGSELAENAAVFLEGPANVGLRR